MGYHLPPEHVRAIVTAYGRRRDCRGDIVYSRMSARSKYGTTTVRFPRFC